MFGAFFLAGSMVLSKAEPAPVITADLTGKAILARVFLKFAFWFFRHINFARETGDGDKRHDPPPY